MTPKLIGLSGRKRSGKDTVGSFLHTTHRNISFASPLKEAVRVMFNWTVHHVDGHLKDEVDERWGFSPRYVLQTIGTDVCRKLDPELWVKNLCQRLNNGANLTDGYVVTDVRFLEELTAIHSMGGVVWRIERPGFSPSDVHESESALDDATFDATLLNDGTIEDLRAKVERLLNG